MKSNKLFYSTETGLREGERIETIKVSSQTFEFYTKAIEHFGNDARVECHRKWYTIVSAKKSKEKGYVDFLLKEVK